MPAELESPEVEVPQFGEDGASIRSFRDDKSFVRVLVGGRGSGKSRAVIADITEHIWLNPGAKAIVARETELSQSDSTIDSAWQYFETMGDLYTTKSGLFKSWNGGRSFRLPTKLAVERMHQAKEKMRKSSDLARWIAVHGDALCGYIEFRGLPAAEKGKFRGMECSYLALVEADQIAEKQFALSMACLRWKGADPDTCDEKGFIRDRCVVLDTNPPGTGHWIAKMEERELAKLPEDRTVKFWHIDTRENEHNLPENYIRDTILTPYASNPAMIDRMLHGKYADAFDGEPVYYAYSIISHEWEDLKWPMGATLGVGMDGATHNASIICAVKTDRNNRLHVWAMKEIVLTGSDTDRQCVELLKVLAEDFAFWNSGEPICPQTIFFCDPALRNSNYTTRGPTASALKVIHSHGIFPGYKIGLGIQPSIAAVNRLLQQNTQVKTGPSEYKTVWNFRIDTKGCPMLTQAMRGKYRYPTKEEPGHGSDLPVKGELCDFVDDVADSFRYLCCNVLDIAEEQHEPALTARYKELPNPEPARTI